MKGAILGDIVGSRFEFDNNLSKDFRFLTKNCSFTDDTVMTCAVAQAILDCNGDYSDLSEKTVAAMQRIGRRYPYCGYGRKFIEWMFTDGPQPYNSFGNGAAMRISPVGFAAESIEQAKEMSAAVTRVSHNHPEGMKGAEATAVAIVLARQGKSKDEIKSYIEENYSYDFSTTVEEYRQQCGGHGKEICQVSVPQAFVCFFEGRDYVDVIRNCISIGGDSDTIAAIAGGIAEAYYGVPAGRCFNGLGCEDFLDEKLQGIVDAFRAKFPGKDIDYNVFDPNKSLEDYAYEVKTAMTTLTYYYTDTEAEELIKRKIESGYMQEYYNEEDSPLTAAYLAGYTCG